MIAALYVEAAVRSLPRTHAIMQRFSKLPVIPCERYTEVFNPRSQNFRLQKARPSLIPAHEFDGFVLSTQDGYGHLEYGVPDDVWVLPSPYRCVCARLAVVYRLVATARDG